MYLYYIQFYRHLFFSGCQWENAIQVAVLRLATGTNWQPGWLWNVTAMLRGCPISNTPSNAANKWLHLFLCNKGFKRWIILSPSQDSMHASAEANELTIWMLEPLKVTNNAKVRAGQTGDTTEILHNPDHHILVGSSWSTRSIRPQLCPCLRRLSKFTWVITPPNPSWLGWALVNI